VDGYVDAWRTEDPKGVERLFTDDGRVRDFEEWAYWPGKPYTASEH
jgi:hypothetical protein